MKRNKDEDAITRTRRRCYEKPLTDVLYTSRWELSEQDQRLLSSNGSVSGMKPRRAMMMMKQLRRRIPAILLAIRVLAIFEEKYGRRPRAYANTDESAIQNDQDDSWKGEELCRLREIRSEVMKQSDVHGEGLLATLLPDQILEYGSIHFLNNIFIVRSCMNQKPYMYQRYPYAVVCLRRMLYVY